MTGFNKFGINLIKLDGSFNRLGEVLSGAFLLEFFNLGPDLLRKLVTGSDTVQDAWQSQGLQPPFKLLLEILGLRHLRVDDVVKYGFQLLLHGADSRWNQVAQMVVEFGCCVELSRAVHEFDVVLWVWHLDGFSLHGELIVN